MTQDIRWLQRFSNYRKALQTLAEAVALGEQRELSEDTLNVHVLLIDDDDLGRTALRGLLELGVQRYCRCQC